MAEFVFKASVHPQVLSKLPEYGKDFTEAYQFCVKLRSTVKHPILFNFAANKEAYRIKLKIGKHSFAKLLKLATALKIVKYYGNNLHIISRTKEKKLFNIKTNDYQEVSHADLKRFTTAQVIIKNIKSQQRAIKKKAIVVKKGSDNSFATILNHVNQSINSNTNLSCRKAGKLLNVSHTKALYELQRLKSFGLTVTKNTVVISKEVYNHLKQKRAGTNCRFNKLNGTFYYVCANIIVYKAPVLKSSLNSGFSYCSNDC